ncbi:hypothetical protein ABFS83_07G083700 [Erythranthe nasuta]
MGDFNCILSPEEKSGGNIPQAHELTDFQECSMSLGIQDLPYRGCKLTWSNSTVGNTIWSKLDRAMCNNAWFSNALNSDVQFLQPGMISDHSPCLLTMKQPDPARKRPFKFYNMWAQHHTFNHLMQHK